MPRALPLAAALALAATPSPAHLDPGPHGSLMAGVSHPLLGLDQVPVMTAVGLRGAVQGGHARWAPPTAPVGAMVTGFALAVLGVAVPLAEPMILLAVVALGTAVAPMVRMPLGAALAAMALFGLFHGHAPGGEVGSAEAMALGVGVAASTVVLHAAGLPVAGGCSRGLRHERLVRGLGWASAVGGPRMALAG